MLPPDGPLSQAGNDDYNAASNVMQTLTVNKAVQTITFGALAARTYGDAPFDLSATASSGLAVSYISSDETVAAVAGHTVTIVGAGAATITASQAGDSNYKAAADVQQTLQVEDGLPTVLTSAVSSITNSTASCGGDVTGHGGTPVTARGVCWSTSENPTIADSKTTEGAVGVFTSSIEGLAPGTDYYVRAYAINTYGTAYGDQVCFATRPATDSSIGDGNWSDTDTWSDGQTPLAAQHVAITHQVTLDTDAAILNLTIDAGGILTIGAGHALTVNGTLDAAAGSIVFAGSGTLDLAGPVTRFGTFTGGAGQVIYSGAGDQTIAAGAYYNLTLGGGGAKTLGGDLDVDGDLTIGSGVTLDVSGSSYDLNVAGDWTDNGAFNGRSGTVTLDGAAAQAVVGDNAFYDLSIANTHADQRVEAAGGTLAVQHGFAITDGIFAGTADYHDVTIGAGGALALSGDITVSGDWANSGALTPSNHEVRFDGADQRISGATSFYSLTKTAASADILTFEADSTTTVAHALILQGSTGATLALRSSENGTHWHLEAPVSTDLAWLDVRDCDNADGAPLHARDVNTVDSGNNVNWLFDLPKVATDGISGITTTSVTVDATISAFGSSAVTAHGVCWSTAENPKIDDAASDLGPAPTTVGAFEDVVTGLSPGTTYHLRAYATNTAGTGYGEDRAFTTVCAAQTVGSATHIGTSGATANWNAVHGAQGYYLDVSASPAFDTFVGAYHDLAAGTGSSFSITGLDPGVTYYYRVRARNSAGVYSDYSDTVTVTTALITSSAPVATLFDAPNAVTNATEYRLRIGGIGVTAYQYKLDDGPWSDKMAVSEPLAFSETEPGGHTLCIIGQDAAGLCQPTEGATVVHWTIDRTAPAAELVNGPQGVSGLTEIDVRVAGEGVRYYKYLLDKGEWSEASPVSRNILESDLAEGSHRLVVVGADLAGNWQPAQDGTLASWTIDSRLLAAELSNLPPNPSPQTSIDVTVGGLGLHAYKYSLDGGMTWSYALIAERIECDDLVEGSHTLLVNGYDIETDRWQDGGAGEDPDPATRYQWTVDTTGPAAVDDLAAAPGDPCATAINLSWTAVEDGLLEYRIWYSQDPITPDTLDGAVSLFDTDAPGDAGSTETFNLSGLQPGVTYYFAIESRDRAGNWSSLSTAASSTTEDARPVINAFELTGGGAMPETTGKPES